MACAPWTPHISGAISPSNSLPAHPRWQSGSKSRSSTTRSDQRRALQAWHLVHQILTPTTCCSKNSYNQQHGQVWLLLRPIHVVSHHHVLSLMHALILHTSNCCFGTHCRSFLKILDHLLSSRIFNSHHFHSPFITYFALYTITQVFVNALQSYWP